ncbi:tetratricopeptide repeat protein [Pontibacter sp. MBLB2868]|uniref:tetratricopeptide repeat protein n=1 Tax=Pontibacter sp. MBLB2868 TaxID=3451555 RepID=UPI003F753F03
MKKLLFAAMAVLITATVSFAQEQSALVLPMFGNKPKTEEQQQKDEKFLTSCDKSFTNRQEASAFFMERGWEYYNEGQVDTAMYRFNLAWLLNPNNKDTYWAFGLISSAKGNEQEAISFYEKTLAIDPKNSLLLADIGASYVTLYTEKHKKKNLRKADKYLSESVAADSANAYALYKFAVVKFHTKKYAEAWEYLHKSRSLDLRTIDYTFVADLVEKMPDPMGVFKSSDAAAVTN